MGDEVAREQGPERNKSAAESQSQGHGVALLLTAAAILVAIVGGRASALSASASTSWDEATREKVKEAAAYVEQVRYIYGVEVPRALTLTEIRLRIETLEEMIEEEPVSPKTQDFLEYEKAAQEDVLDQTLSASELAADPRYETEEGFDPLLMLVDERATQPDFLKLEPDHLLDEGVHTSDDSIMMLASAVPIAFAFLCGSLAKTFSGARRLWLVAGILFLLAGAVSALVIEVG